jgi:hypothetical protein
MAEAIRRECDPLMYSFGFRHPRHWSWERWPTTRRNVYIRWRDGDYDEVLLIWGHFGRPWFTMEFFMSRLTPPHPPGALIRRTGGSVMYAWDRFRRAPPCRDKFGPWRSILATVAVTKQCLTELNAFMLEERPSAYIGFPHWRRVGPGEYAYSTLKHHGNPMLDDERDGDFVHPDGAAR